MHECDLICEKMLSCGNRRCEERDHRGGCPPCLRSLFEEVCGHVRFIGSGRLCSRWSCERERYMQSESATNKVHSIIVMQRTNLSRYQRRRNHPYFPLQSRPCKVTFLDPLPFVKTLFLLINSKHCLSVAYPLVARTPASFWRCLRVRFECWVFMFVLSLPCSCSHMSFRFVIGSSTKSMILCERKTCIKENVVLTLRETSNLTFDRC